MTLAFIVLRSSRFLGEDKHGFLNMIDEDGMGLILHQP
jgi:hypothetical protein